MSKKIIMSLSEKGLDYGIKEIQNYSKELDKKTKLFAKRIGQEIKKRADSGFGSAVIDDIVNGTSKTASVSVTTELNGNTCAVIATGEDAIWVEFGAGVYFNGSPGSSPHPKGQELGFVIGSYGEGHGNRETWGYYDGGELVLTHGTPASMPLYNATQDVIKIIVLIAREVYA